MSGSKLLDLVKLLLNNHLPKDDTLLQNLLTILPNYFLTRRDVADEIIDVFKYLDPDQMVKNLQPSIISFLLQLLGQSCETFDKCIVLFKADRHFVRRQAAQLLKQYIPILISSSGDKTNKANNDRLLESLLAHINSGLVTGVSGYSDVQAAMELLDIIYDCPNSKDNLILQKFNFCSASLEVIKNMKPENIDDIFNYLDITVKSPQPEQDTLQLIIKLITQLINNDDGGESRSGDDGDIHHIHTHVNFGGFREGIGRRNTNGCGRKDEDGGSGRKHKAMILCSWLLKRSDFGQYIDLQHYLLSPLTTLMAKAATTLAAQKRLFSRCNNNNNSNKNNNINNNNNTSNDNNNKYSERNNICVKINTNNNENDGGNISSDAVLACLRLTSNAIKKFNHLELIMTLCTNFINIFFANDEMKNNSSSSPSSDSPPPPSSPHIPKKKTSSSSTPLFTSSSSRPPRFSSSSQLPVTSSSSSQPISSELPPPSSSSPSFPLISPSSLRACKSSLSRPPPLSFSSSSSPPPQQQLPVSSLSSQPPVASSSSPQPQQLNLKHLLASLDVLCGTFECERTCFKNELNLYSRARDTIASLLQRYSRDQRVVYKSLLCLEKILIALSLTIIHETIHYNKFKYNNNNNNSNNNNNNNIDDDIVISGADVITGDIKIILIQLLGSDIWDLRDSVISFVGQLFASDFVPLSLTMTSFQLHKLLECSLNDEEEYVRSSGLKALAILIDRILRTMTKMCLRSHEIDKNFDKSAGHDYIVTLVEKVARTSLADEEAVVRRSAVALISEYVLMSMTHSDRIKPSDSNQDTSDLVASKPPMSDLHIQLITRLLKVLSNDLDWEVKVSVLNFLKSLLCYHFSTPMNRNFEVTVGVQELQKVHPIDPIINSILVSIIGSLDDCDSIVEAKSKEVLGAFHEYSVADMIPPRIKATLDEAFSLILRRRTNLEAKVCEKVIEQAKKKPTTESNNNNNNMDANDDNDNSFRVNSLLEDALRSLESPEEQRLRRNKQLVAVAMFNDDDDNDHDDGWSTDGDEDDFTSLDCYN
ncbi:hypothetical protein HELRODRAFT_193326 [Helobdella robusta]|uniref:Uncharacterized protein n=1 Tax=Helobdella robusta TaxID=6412 RepID=T1FUW1_HELRO|nr:hypothetical protein HELRODRAFT_193326 [Helobdella robusta]ESN97262.1 hypothetical protein HELRODRAFT_193326 [Helobdella robusta]